MANTKLVVKTIHEYFQIDQDLSDTLFHGVPDQKHQSQTLKGRDTDAALQQARSRGFSGKIISAVARIPFEVSILNRGLKATLIEGHSRLDSLLSDISSNPALKHTIIGWTGELKDGPFPGPKDLDKEKVYATAARAGQSSTEDDYPAEEVVEGNFRDYELEAPNVGEAEPATTPFYLAGRKQRLLLEDVIRPASEACIIPVWLGEKSTDRLDTIIVQDQTRFSELVKYGVSALTSLNPLRELDQSRVFENYKHMNEFIAEAILQTYSAGDVIWIHEDHLMLVPAILREKIPSAYVYYSGHWTFEQQNESLLSEFEAALMKGLLGASIITLPTSTALPRMRAYYKDVIDVQSSEAGNLVAGSREIELFSIPRIIDPFSVGCIYREDAHIQLAVNIARRQYGRHTLLLAFVPDNDSTGATMLLNAFDHLLFKYRGVFPKRPVLVMIPPSSLSHYRSFFGESQSQFGLGAEIARRMTHINGKYGTFNYLPVRYFDSSLPLCDYAALLRIADLSIATSDDELVTFMAVEFGLCQREEGRPSLVLHREDASASFDGLTENEAVHFASYTVEDQIVTSLRQPLEARKQAQVAFWTHLVKRQLRDSTHASLTKILSLILKSTPVPLVPLMDANQFQAVFAESQKRMFLCDYDGTLTPIVNDPDAALPSDKLLKILRQLAANEANHVWIISGRSQFFLEKQFGHIESIGLSAEHGAFIRKPKTRAWVYLGNEVKTGWQSETKAAFAKLAASVAGSWVEHKEVAVVWHYRRAADHNECYARAVSTKKDLETRFKKEYDVEVMLGKANLEVRPKELSKGNLVTNLVEHELAGDEKAFVLCAGDDVTDEDMFRSLVRCKVDPARIFCCLVAKEDRTTLASYRFDEPSALLDAIATLADSDQ